MRLFTKDNTTMRQEMLAFVRERIQWLVDNRVEHNVSAHDFAHEITNLHSLLV